MSAGVVLAVLLASDASQAILHAAGSGSFGVGGASTRGRTLKPTDKARAQVCQSSGRCVCMRVCMQAC